MNRKIILPAILMVLVIFTGYFVLQLISMPAYWCRPYFDFECDAYAQFICLGDDYFADPEGSWCNGGTCRTLYYIYCDDGSGKLKYKDYIYCDDEWGCDGVN
jgi:hypothetical protein